MNLCAECENEHEAWITCWGAYKNRYHSVTGREWYDDHGNPLTDAGAFNCGHEFCTAERMRCHEG